MTIRQAPRPRDGAYLGFIAETRDTLHAVGYDPKDGRTTTATKENINDPETRLQALSELTRFLQRRVQGTRPIDLYVDDRAMVEHLRDLSQTEHGAVCVHKIERRENPARQQPRNRSRRIEWSSPT